MSAARNSPKTWSDALGRRLLIPLPREALVELFRHVSDTAGEDEISRTQRFRRILTAARDTPEIRRAIMAAWRQQHGAIVAAAELVPIEGSQEQCERLLRAFRGEEVLLELITDPRDDGWQLAEWVIDNLPSPSARRELRAVLDDLSVPDAPTVAGTVVRVVVFGGHPRDASKMSRRMFDQSPCDVRWRPCEKSQGSPDDKDLHDAMCGADAVILVSGMVSHNIMHIVKRYVQAHKVPWKAVSKATDPQLRSALSELFPNLMD